MNKRIISAVMSVCLFTAGIFKPNAYAETLSVKNMFVLGDSISSGYGLEGYDIMKSPPQCYANVLKEMLSADTVINEAEDGLTSSGLRKRLENGDYDSYIDESDFIIFSIGGNDVLDTFVDVLIDTAENFIRNNSDPDNEDNTFEEAMSGLAYERNEDRYREKLDTFTENFDKIIDYIKDRNSSATLMVLTLYNPFNAFFVPDTINESAEILCKAVSQTIITHSGGEYLVADVKEAFDDKATLYTTIKKLDIHPNAEGHKVIAEVAYSVLTETEVAADVTMETVPLETYPPVLPDDSEGVQSDSGSNMLVVTAGTVIVAIAVSLAIIIKLTKKSGR